MHCRWSFSTAVPQLLQFVRYIVSKYQGVLLHIVLLCYEWYNELYCTLTVCNMLGIPSERSYCTEEKLYLAVSC